MSWETLTGVTFEIVSSIKFWPYNKIEIFRESWMAICDNTLSREWGGTIFVNWKEVIFEKRNPFEEQFQKFIDEINWKWKVAADVYNGANWVEDLILANNV